MDIPLYIILGFILLFSVIVEHIIRRSSNKKREKFEIFTPLKSETIRIDNDPVYVYNKDETYSVPTDYKVIHPTKSLFHGITSKMPTMTSKGFSNSPISTVVGYAGSAFYASKMLHPYYANAAETTSVYVVLAPKDKELVVTEFADKIEIIKYSSRKDKK